MARNLISIYDYTDYRLFLDGYYGVHKKRDRKFTFRSFAAQAGVSPSVLRDIIAGRRNLSLEVMRKYATAMDLSERETRYFEVIVGFTNAKSNDEKNRFFSEISRFRGTSARTFLDEQQYEFFSHWYHGAIRELITLESFREDPAWIASRLQPSITVSQARKSLELLLHLGLIERDSTGRLVQTSAAVRSEEGIRSLVMRNFHSETIARAAESLETVPPEKREISSLTLGISDEAVGRIRERIKAFKEELLGMVVADQQPSRKVYQLNFQFFPLLRDEEEV